MKNIEEKKECKYEANTERGVFCTARQKECIYPKTEDIQKCEEASNEYLVKQYPGFEYMFDKPFEE